MALNFPASPVLDDTFTDGTTTWKWNGTAWIVDSGAVAAANVDQFKTVAGDTGSTTANSPTDTLTIAGGTNLTSSVTGDIVTLDVTGSLGDPDQNLFATINSDAGNVTADSTTDAITVAGAGSVSTGISGKTLTITGSTPSLSIDDLTDVDTTNTTPVAGNVLKWDGSKWSPGTDATTGGAGTDADTLDGQDSIYFLNYNNLQNTPSIPTDVSDLTDTTTLLFDGVFGSLTSKPTTIAGYGITDAVVNFADLGAKPTTIAGYGITDAVVNFADLGTKPTTISGYGITDALSTSSNLSALADVDTTAPATGQALVWDGDSWGPDTVSGGGGDPDQNLWYQFNGDAGSVTANSITDTLTIAGGTNISTSASNDTITINFTGTLGVTSYNALSEVVNTGRTIDKSYMPAFAMIRMNNVGNTAYSVDSHGYTGNNPTIYAIGGMTIAFDLDGVGGHPFEIQDGTGTAYSTGLTHVDVIGNVSTGASANGQDAGTLYWEVPETISGGYRYQCTLHASMVGAITVKRISII
jgi:plastocyanin